MTADGAELDAFLKALDRTRLAHSDCCIAGGQNYPAHGVRRSVAVAFPLRAVWTKRSPCSDIYVSSRH